MLREQSHSSKMLHKDAANITEIKQDYQCKPRVISSDKMKNNRELYIKPEYWSIEAIQ